MNSVTRLFALTVALAGTSLAASSRAAGPIQVNPQPLPPIHADSRARASYQGRPPGSAGEAVEV